MRKKIDFISIGGWAVYFLTKAVKSKDIDIIVDLKNSSKIKEGFELKKTDFLKKYEIEIEGISIDIYVPFYSKFAIPVEDVMKNTIVIENFKIPRAEVLLLLKQQAELERKDSIKGQKDRVDIICLLKSDLIDWNFYKKMIERYGLKDYPKRLESIIRQRRIRVFRDKRFEGSKEDKRKDFEANEVISSLKLLACYRLIQGMSEPS